MRQLTTAAAVFFVLLLGCTPTAAEDKVEMTTKYFQTAAVGYFRQTNLWPVYQVSPEDFFKFLDHLKKQSLSIGIINHPQLGTGVTATFYQVYPNRSVPLGSVVTLGAIQPPQPRAVTPDATKEPPKS